MLKECNITRKGSWISSVNNFDATIIIFYIFASLFALFLYYKRNKKKWFCRQFMYDQLKWKSCHLRRLLMFFYYNLKFIHETVFLSNLNLFRYSKRSYIGTPRYAKRFSSIIGSDIGMFSFRSHYEHVSSRMKRLLSSAGYLMYISACPFSLEVKFEANLRV